MTKQKPLKIIGIKCGKKYYITRYEEGYYGPYHSLKNYIINGDKPTESFHDKWSVLKSKLKTIQEKQNVPNDNYRYELKNTDLANDKIPLTFDCETVEREDNDSYDRYWKDEYNELSSLYKLVYDEHEPILVDVPFEYEELMSIKGDIHQEGFSFSADNCKITEDSLVFPVINQVLYPNILLPTKTCRLPIDKTYKIILAHIQEHIDGKYAYISENYNDHFTVKKRISFEDPEEYTVNVNAMYSRRKPKYEKRYRTHRDVTLFTLNNNKNCKYGVTVNPFVGENQTDLKNKIETFLKELMEHVNAPVVDCPHCNGDGVVYETKDVKELVAKGK